MITGFNTDIEHDGVVYHVQTEDKGLESPLILSLVYAGGAILASKRSPYQDLIASGFDEEALVQRLKHQHRLICAAINAGRIEDLKRMGARTGEEVQTPAEAPPFEIVSNATDYASPVEPTEAEQAEPTTPAEVVSNASDYADFAQTSQPTPLPPQVADMPFPQTVVESSPYTVYDSRRQSPLGEAAEPDEGLVLTLLAEEDFRAGQTFQIRILVEDRSGVKEKPLAGVTLSVKVLGTTFRPQIYSVKTERDGVAVVSAQIPRFTSGRAGILIRAVAGGRTTEMRRVIHAAWLILISEVGKRLRIHVNGELREAKEGVLLAEVISELKLKPEQIAIELNREVVRRAHWEATALREGDKVEIVHFVGGGCGGGRSRKQEAGARGGFCQYRPR